MCVQQHQIYFMTDNQSIIQLQRLKDQKLMVEVKELFIKEKDKQKYQKNEEF